MTIFIDAPINTALWTIIYICGIWKVALQKWWWGAVLGIVYLLAFTMVYFLFGDTTHMYLFYGTVCVVEVLLVRLFLSIKKYVKRVYDNKC